MKIVAIIQARTGSNRLPGKVLLPLCGSTVLGQVASRVKSSTQLDAVWIATTTDLGDDAVQSEATRLGLPCFRGSVEDVLGRYHDSAVAAAADAVVRVTSDCPLFDSALLNQMLVEFRAEIGAGKSIDYMSNVIERTYPRGLDAEIFTMAALDRAWREATRNHDREHVTPYFYTNPERFKLRSYRGQQNRSQHRWTLDTTADWDFVQAVYAQLFRLNQPFGTDDVLALLARKPEIMALNAHIEQKKS